MPDSDFWEANERLMQEQAFDDERGRGRDRPRAKTPDELYPIDITHGQDLPLQSSDTEFTDLESSSGSEPEMARSRMHGVPGGDGASAGGAAAEDIAGYWGDGDAARRCVERARVMWNALGEDNKWREWIDGKFHDFGPRVFDDCLHRGNFGHPEDGFLSSMQAADRRVGGALGSRTTVDMFLEVHALAMAHCKGAGVVAGRLRHWTRGNRISIDPRLEPFPEDVEREIVSMRPRVAVFQRTRKKPDGLHDSDSSYDYELDYPPSRVIFVPLKRRRRRRYIAHYLRRFYRRIRRAQREVAGMRVAGSAAGKKPSEGNLSEENPSEGEPSGGWVFDPEDPDSVWRERVVAAVAWLQQVLQRIEPCPDGNQRVAVLFVNKHLTELGFHPTILQWPGEADVITHKAWAQRIHEGLDRWEKERAEISAEREAARL